MNLGRYDCEIGALQLFGQRGIGTKLLKGGGQTVPVMIIDDGGAPAARAQLYPMRSEHAWLAVTWLRPFLTFLEPLTLPMSMANIILVSIWCIGLSTSLLRRADAAV